MWFVFPQLKGLGRSWMAAEYSIASRLEAEEYVKHSILGSRLIDCTRLVIAIEGRSIEHIFGSIDAKKFRSSMTLFSAIAGANPIFSDALHKYFGGQPDQLTLDRL